MDSGSLLFEHSLVDEILNPKDDTLEEMNARAEASLRNRALTMSSVCIYVLLLAHIAFSYFGKSLVIPEIVWAIVLSPWLGAAGGKVSILLEKLLKGK